MHSLLFAVPLHCAWMAPPEMCMCVYRNEICPSRCVLNWIPTTRFAFAYFLLHGWIQQFELCDKTSKTALAGAECDSGEEEEKKLHHIPIFCPGKYSIQYLRFGNTTCLFIPSFCQWALKMKQIVSWDDMAYVSFPLSVFSPAPVEAFFHRYSVV